MLKDTSRALYVIAGLTCLGAMFGSKLGLIDSGIYAVCAYFIGSHRSRVAAGFALFWAVLSLGALFLQTPGMGSATLLFGLLGIWAGVRALEATVKIRGSLANVASLVSNAVGED